MTKKVKKHISFIIIFIFTTGYVASFRIEYIHQDVLIKIKDKSVTYIIFRTLSDDSIWYGFCCIAFIEYSDCRKEMLDYTNFFVLITNEETAK